MTEIVFHGWHRFSYEVSHSIRIFIINLSISTINQNINYRFNSYLYFFNNFTVIFFLFFIIWNQKNIDMNRYLKINTNMSLLFIFIVLLFAPIYKYCENILFFPRINMSILYIAILFTLILYNTYYDILNRSSLLYDYINV